MPFPYPTPHLFKTYAFEPLRWPQRHGPMYANTLLHSSQGGDHCESRRGGRVYLQNIQCRAGFAMMSPSAISFLLRILGRKGKLARKASGGELVDRSRN
jgi:hypothetical protein